MALNAPLTVPVFALMAALSGMGVGSAGLPVLYLTLFLHVPQMEAQGHNLLFFLAAAGASFSVHLFRTPPLWRLTLILLAAGLPGALLGAHLSAVVSAAFLRRAFGVFLISAGLCGLLAPKKTDQKRQKNDF